MSYTKEQQGQTVFFDTQPDGQVPFPFSFVLLGLFPSLIFLIVSPIGFIISMLFFVLLGWLKMSSSKSKKFRNSSKFNISKDGISIKDEIIKMEDIHRVIVRNHVIPDNVESDVVYDHGTLAASGNMAGRAFDKKVAAISYRVEVEATGIATSLGGGFNETTAFAVSSDVSTAIKEFGWKK